MNNQGGYTTVNGPKHIIANRSDEAGLRRTLLMLHVSDYNKDGISDIYQFSYTNNDKIHFFNSSADYETVDVSGFARVNYGANTERDYTRINSRIQPISAPHEK